MLITLTLAMCFQLKTILNSYFEYPTKTKVICKIIYFLGINKSIFKMDYYYDSKIVFPAVTACNLNGLQNSKFFYEVPNTMLGQAWVYNTGVSLNKNYFNFFRSKKFMKETFLIYCTRNLTLVNHYI